MADLLARFRLVDAMSDKLDRIAQSGLNMSEQIENAADGINGTFTSVARSADGVAKSYDQIRAEIGDLDIGGEFDQSIDKANRLKAGIEEAASSTDHWTRAVGSYSKELLEATYSTEELVDMGLKSAEALEEQDRMLELCERSASSLSNSTEAAAKIQEDLNAAMDKAAETAKAVAKNDDVSAETKEALAKASTEAADAMQELEKAQQEADAAMEAYNQTMTSGTSDLNELEAAAERAGHAAEALAEANGKASDATEELSKATETASEEAESGGKKGKNAIAAIASALAAAGITAKLKEMAGAVYELSDGFSEAEKTIVGATGATGRELDEFMSSSLDIYASSSAESLNDVAESMVAVRAATGLAGDALQEATDAALTLNNVFDFEVSESSRTASALMKNFGLSAEEATKTAAGWIYRRHGCVREEEQAA